MARSFLAAYRSREWVRAPPTLHVPHPRWTGARIALPGEREGSTAEAEGILPALVAGFASLRRGATLEANLVPVAPARTLPWWAEGRPHRPVPAVGARTGPNGARRPTLAETGSRAATSPLCWSALLTLAIPSYLDSESVVRVAEGAFRGLDGTGVRFRRRNGYARREPRALLTEPELAGILPTWEATELGAAHALGDTGGLPVGYLASGAPVVLPVPPAEGRHLAVLGETGMGKSSLLVALARRISRSSALVLFDPLGETGDAVRAELAADGRKVRRIEPGEPTALLNALDPEGGDAGSVDFERRANDLVHALRRVRGERYRDGGFWGPRLEEMLTLALRAAASVPNGTFEDAHALLSAHPLAARRASRGSGATVVELLERVRARPDDAEGARRLLFEIVRDPTLRTMLCARTPAITPAELVAPGAVSLVCGRAALVGASTARYLLSVYLALLWSAVLARRNGAKLFVVLDEAQWFAHESLSEILRLGRRYNVHAVVVTQSLASLPAEIAEAVRTNVADVVAFRGSPEDARELARVAGGVAPDRLLALARGSAAVLLGKGERTAWVRASRLPARPPSPSTVGRTGGGCRTVEEPETRRPARERSSPQVGATAPPDDAPNHVLTSEQLWDRLVRQAAELPLDQPMRVEVPAASDPASSPETRLWRALGSRLGRSGILLRSERTATGTLWWLDRARLRDT